ncbi:MAG: hypothetical protein ACMUJM_16820 [bacterium]
MDRGFSPPYISILLVIICVLIYFFGWSVLVYAAGAVILIAAGTAIYDKITHNTNCAECIIVKEMLSKRTGVNKDLIKTKHEKHFDTSMNIRAYMEENKSVLVNIEYGGEDFKIIDE